jgi:hypothetical protein
MDLVNIVISYTKDIAIAITHNGEPEDDDCDHFEISGISLRSFSHKWTKEIKGKWVKMCNIEQNDAGEYFAIAYQDNGEFAVLVLDS